MISPVWYSSCVRMSSVTQVRYGFQFSLIWSSCSGVAGPGSP